MKTICIFPGSFDPVTIGHLDLMRRASAIFDEVVVAVLYNPSKKSMFSVAERLQMLKECCTEFGNVKVDSFVGLLAEYAKQFDRAVVLRGVRDLSDWTNEARLAEANAMLNPGLETLFLQASSAYGAVSSSAVKEIAFFGGDITGFVPENVACALRLRIAEQREHEYV